MVSFDTLFEICGKNKLVWASIWSHHNLCCLRGPRDMTSQICSGNYQIIEAAPKTTKRLNYIYRTWHGICSGTLAISVVQGDSEV
jgi:hypothetical protein